MLRNPLEIFSIKLPKVSFVASKIGVVVVKLAFIYSFCNKLLDFTEVGLAFITTLILCTVFMIYGQIPILIFCNLMDDKFAFAKAKKFSSSSTLHKA